MVWLFWFLALLLGYFFGLFLSLPVLVITTVFSIISSYRMMESLNSKGFEVRNLVVGGVIIALILMNITMWSTFYVSTHQTWISSSAQKLHGFILR